MAIGRSKSDTMCAAICGDKDWLPRPRLPAGTTDYIFGFGRNTVKTLCGRLRHITDTHMSHLAHKHSSLMPFCALATPRAHIDGDRSECAYGHMLGRRY